MASCRSADCVQHAVDYGGCTNFDCDWAVIDKIFRDSPGQHLVGIDSGPIPYIANAQFHLDQLRQTVHDGLIGVNDECLRDSLLEDITAIVINLDKALL